MKKAQVTMYVVFIFVAIIIVTIAAILAPMGVLFNTEMFKAGEDILLMANQSMESIQNATVKAAIQGSTGSAIDAAQNNIDVNNNIFQYSWIVILGIGGLVAFLYSRRMVEYGGGFI